MSQLKGILHAVIHPYAVLRYRRRYQSLAAFGKGSLLDEPRVLSHPEKIYIGNETKILEGARLQTYPDLEGSIRIGDHSYLCYDLTILAGGDVIIGDHVLAASRITMISFQHGMNPETDAFYMDQPLATGRIQIDDGTWIGENATILSNVHIGRKCIIGANAVVTRDIPNYCIAVGSPARVVKKYDFEKHSWVKA